jgi:hypothetical protein
VTLGLLRAEQPELSDATAIAASLEAPSVFSRVFERHHAAVHRYLTRRLGTALADELAGRRSGRADQRKRRHRVRRGAFDDRAALAGYGAVTAFDQRSRPPVIR